MHDFAALFTHLSVLSPNIIIVGNFNIHVDGVNNLPSRDLTSCLDSFGFQRYNFSTHSKGHILVLVCYSGVIPAHCKANLFSSSDHKLISFDINILASKICKPCDITFRKINDTFLSFSHLLYMTSHLFTASRPRPLMNSHPTIILTSKMFLIHLLHSNKDLFHFPSQHHSLHPTCVFSKTKDANWNANLKKKLDLLYTKKCITIIFSFIRSALFQLNLHTALV